MAQRRKENNGNGVNLGFEQKLWSADEPFDEAMQRLTNTLAAQFAESANLDKRITKNLASLGFTPEKS